MKYFIKFIIAAIMLFPAEILAQRVYSEAELKKIYPFQPFRKKFKFSKNKFVKERKKSGIFPLDTTIVYIDSFYDEGTNKILYFFRRFFSNGEVYTSYDYEEMPDEIEFNDLSYGKFGMFRIKGEDLIVELYTHLSLNHFVYHYAKIRNNELKFYRYINGKFLWAGSRVPLYYTLVKKEVNLFNYKIKWR